MLFFGLSSSSLLLLLVTRHFGLCILRPSSGVPCLSGYELQHLHHCKTPCLTNSQTLKMISQVKPYLYPEKQRTPEEGRRMQQPKRCVLNSNNKHEDNSPKKITHKISFCFLLFSFYDSVGYHPPFSTQ